MDKWGVYLRGMCLWGEVVWGGVPVGSMGGGSIGGVPGSMGGREVVWEVRMLVGGWGLGGGGGVV